MELKEIRLNIQLRNNPEEKKKKPRKPTYKSLFVTAKKKKSK